MRHLLFSKSFVSDVSGPCLSIKTLDTPVSQDIGVFYCASSDVLIKEVS